MAPVIQFPVYVIASREGVVVVATDSEDCILLFHSEALAEQQIAKIKVTHPQLGVLHALAVPDAAQLREGLKDLPQDVTCAVWDPTGTPAGFQHVCMTDLLHGLPK